MFMRHVLELYMTLDPTSRTPPVEGSTVIVTRVPLFTFCQLLLVVVQHDAHQAFTKLRSHYLPWLRLHEQLVVLTDRVGVLYCGMRPSARDGGNNLNNLLRAFMGGAGMDDRA